MAVKAVDASALAAPLFGEPEAEGVAERLGDARLVGPALLGFERAIIYTVEVPEAPRAGAGAQAAFRLRTRQVAVDHEEAINLPIGAGLTAYDASYLWWSRQLGAELVTLDRRLAKAAAVA